ncbi:MULTISPECIES: hypothetical protein, partial [unclassified Microcoleus]|uniref:hypothetical protein n=1 Tax=unclassified Microcoleus TaxID=2642155 RepID=UPI002FD0CD74
LTGVGFLRLGSIKSIKPGENKGDSTKHVAGEKPKMLKNNHLKDWSLYCLQTNASPVHTSSDWLSDRRALV